MTFKTQAERNREHTQRLRDRIQYFDRQRTSQTRTDLETGKRVKVTDEERQRADARLREEQAALRKHLDMIARADAREQAKEEYEYSVETKMGDLVRAERDARIAEEAERRLAAETGA